MIRFVSRALVALALVSTAVVAQRGAPIPQHVTFTPPDATGIYDVGETVGWTVTPAAAPPRHAYKWTIRRNYFLNMYLRASRALDYLLTRPDWDGRTIVLTGGSMGGQQSLVLAGLPPDHIDAVLVCVPAGADTNGDLHSRKAGCPNWPSVSPDVMN